MLRQILGCLLTFAGILLTFVFWYKIIPLEPNFIAWQRDPVEVLAIMGAWAILGGISCLFLSRHIANWAMRVDMLPLEEMDDEIGRAEIALQKAAQRLHLHVKPQLGIYEQPELNAYIVGLTLKNSTLVLSRGAMRHLSVDDLETLICRELLQFKSGDVLGLAFMQGMLFAFTLYVARVLAFLLGTSLRQTEEESTSSNGVEILLTSVLTILLTLPGTLVYGYWSRRSAIRADKAVAAVMGKPSSLSLLAHLPGHHPLRREIFSDAFKLQSRPFPAGLAWLSLQPNLALRSRRLSA